MGIFQPIANLGPAWVFFINLICALVGGIIGTLIITFILKRVLQKSERVDNAFVKFCINAVKVACITILVAIILQMLGVQMSTIVAVLGAAGAALALALRDSLANIAGGFMIIVTHPFKEGDLISVNEDRGRVEHIDLFLTTLRTLDYRTVTIPNGLINTSVVYNESNQELRRVDCFFNISYDSDIDKAKEILYRICEDGPLISMEREPWIGVLKHEDSGLVLECLAYCKEGDQWDANYYLNETVKKEFDKAGIEIPYPHVDVIMKKQMTKLL
ncbi:MAG: mechanosensitive ion channel family protein [Clostridia bacterium]|nr:mechanosensitive ion channel family protein [Clostridia bacterium]